MGETKKPDGDEDAFDANAFEKQKEAEKLAAVQDDLQSVVTTQEIDGVGLQPITKLDALSSRWRQMATAILKKEDPDAYVKYRGLKYPDGPESKSDLVTRKKAYAFAMRHFLDISYTETEPDTPTVMQAAGEHWRQQAVQLLRVIDADAYAEYRKRKYSKGKEPDLKTRKAAYAYAIAAFLEASYKIAGF